MDQKKITDLAWRVKVAAIMTIGVIVTVGIVAIIHVVKNRDTYNSSLFPTTNHTQTLKRTPFLDEVKKLGKGICNPYDPELKKGCRIYVEKTQSVINMSPGVNFEKECCIFPNSSLSLVGEFNDKKILVKYKDIQGFKEWTPDLHIPCGYGDVFYIDKATFLKKLSLTKTLRRIAQEEVARKKKEAKEKKIEEIIERSRI